MKRIVSGSDAIINLELKDSSGNTISLDSPTVVKSLEIKIYTKNTDESNYIVITDQSEVEDNKIKLQSTDLDKLEREQVYIDLYIVFWCEDFSDSQFDFRKKIPTNIILVK